MSWHQLEPIPRCLCPPPWPKKLLLSIQILLPYLQVPHIPAVTNIFQGRKPCKNANGGELGSINLQISSPRYRAGHSLTRLERLYYLEYTQIPKVYFTPHHGHWCKQCSSGNTKANNHIQGHCCNNLIQCCCKCGPAMAQSKLLQQWLWFTLLQQFVPATSIYGGCLFHRKNVADRYRDSHEWLVRCSSLMLEHEEYMINELYLDTAAKSTPRKRKL